MRDRGYNAAREPDKEGAMISAGEIELTRAGSEERSFINFFLFLLRIFWRRW